MASFFSQYPKMIINNKVVTDIIARTAIRDKYTDKLSIYYPYNIQDGDTPEIIASKYYGDPEKHWLVMLANDIINPFFDFSLNYQIFNDYISEKYKNHANSLNIWNNSTWRGEWSPTSYVISNEGEFEHNDTWVRDPNWLDLPNVTDIQKFTGLYAVSAGPKNYIALSATTSAGLYRVDWGDGNIETYGSGVVAEHNYNYPVFDSTNLTLINHNGMQYKQAIVSVTPVTGNLLGVNLNKKHSAETKSYTSSWLDIAINGSHMTSFILGSAIMNVYYTLLEQVYIGHTTQFDFSYLFNSTTILKRTVFHNTTIITTITNLFKGLVANPLDNTGYILILDETNPNIEYVFNRKTATGYYEGSVADDDRIFKYFAANTVTGDGANTVIISNTAYICMQDHTPTIFLNDLAKKYWARIYDGAYWKDEWSNNTLYNIDDVTKYNNDVYICIQQHVSNTINNLSLSNSDYWKTYNNALEYATITPYGYKTNIISTDGISGQSTTQTIFIDQKSYSGTTWKEQWGSDILYDTNDVVRRSNINYICLKAHKSNLINNIVPTNTNYWNQYTGIIGYANAAFNYATTTIQYDNITVSTEKERISIYQYEQELNENKREIKLIRKEYATQIENEFKILMGNSYV